LTHRVAAQGINCVLVARRQEPLGAVAAEIHAKYDVECVTAAIDLSSGSASDQLVTAVGSREIGLYVSNAGAIQTVRWPGEKIAPRLLAHNVKPYRSALRRRLTAGEGQPEFERFTARRATDAEEIGVPPRAHHEPGNASRIL
jgi:NAD(P)-dependent dehydrogenase (short-subunit alcohol dehydrogenase family)